MPPDKLVEKMVGVILMLTFLILLGMVVSVVLKESRYELNYSAEDFTKLMQTCNGSPREFTKIGYEWNTRWRVVCADGVLIEVKL